MGLITRCPGCGTMFKVVPDQLRIAEGWVRCGQCGEVFDASAQLQGPQADAAPVTAAPQEAAGAPPVAAGAEADDEAAMSSLLTEIGEDLPSEAPDSTRLDDEARSLVEDPLDRPFALRREDLGPPEPSVSDLQESLAGEPPLEEPTFVRQARRQARWQRPAVRALLLLAVFGLTLLLAAQVAVHERDRLAARDPALRPWLLRLCAAVGCRISAPRRIEAIVIDSSSFNKLRPDAYRLQVTLRNQGMTPVAMPALELTLTDSQEQPVVRRVLMPGEVRPARTAIAAGSDWAGAAVLGLADNSLSSRVAGYRILAFYP